MARKTLDINYGNVDQMLQNGWTKEDFEELKVAPRSREAALPNGPEGEFVWPLVDGKRLLYTFFNEKERELYRPWYKSHHSGTTSTGKTKSTVDNESWLKLYTEISALDKNGAAMATLMKMMPASVVTPEMRIFGKVLSDEDKAALVKAPVPLYRVLFRYPGNKMDESVSTRKEALMKSIEDEKYVQAYLVSDVQEFIDAGYITKE